jgi:hypothetical protein
VKSEAFLEVIRAAPFQPFFVCLANGERIEVRHPESIAVGGRTAVVVEPDDRTHILDVGLVLKIELAPPVPAGTVSPPGNGGE